MKRILKINVSSSRKNLSKKLNYALWAYRIAFKTTIGISKYHLGFRKTYHLPVELEYQAYWAIENLNFALKVVGEERLLQLNGSMNFNWKPMRIQNCIRSEPKIYMICIFKEETLKLCKQVLLHNSQLKFFLIKLKSGWLELYSATQSFSIKDCWDNSKKQMNS